MYDEQHSFRSGKSVSTAGIELINSIVSAIDKGENTIGIFMDLSKAFDSVCHDKLIGTLQALGISGRHLNWFSSYIYDRKQYVELPHVGEFNQLIRVKSTTKTTTYGVPQGSILGPVLFLCYLKGLPSTISYPHSKLCLYADDSNLIVRGSTKDEVENIANKQLLTIKQFFDSRNLLLNLDKTNFISFHTRQKRNKQLPIIEIENSKIQNVEQTKFLGLIVDENLTWNSHIETIQNKISSGLYILRNMSMFCSVETLKMIYYAHIHSHISYGIVLYGATSNSNLSTILILQKKALRIILKLNYIDSVKEHFAKLGILTVFGLYILETVMVVRAAEDKLPKLGSNHQYLTRHRNEIAVLKHSLEFFKKNPCSTGLKFYNKVPQKIKAVKNFKLFKEKFKKYLIERAIYSFEEYLNL